MKNNTEFDFDSEYRKYLVSMIKQNEGNSYKETFERELTELEKSQLLEGREYTTPPRRQFSAHQKSKIKSRARGLCQTCKNPLPAKHWHAHHILPINHGGPHTVWNAAALCPPCHIEIHKQKPWLSRACETLEEMFDL